MKKLFFIVIDGMPDFGKDTPLSLANKPNIDFLAKNGKCGLLANFTKKESEKELAINGTNWGTAVLLGLPFDKNNLKRGSVEALGVGRELKEDEIAIRCNYAYLDKNGKINRRAGRNELGLKELSKEINKKIKLSSEFEFIYTTGHRILLILRHKKINDKITDTDPLFNDKKAIKCRALLSSAKVTADLVNEFVEKSNKLLENHSLNKKRERKGILPANLILTRGAGRKIKKIFNYNLKYKRKFAFIAPMPAERGICYIAGMKNLWEEMPSGNPKKDSLTCIKILKQNINKYDCFFVFLKGPDPFGHDGDFEGKREIIEWIDKNFFEKLLKITDLDNSIYALASDHATPCRLKRHSNHPIPFFIFGKGLKSKNAVKFSEEGCKKGFFGLMPGKKLFKKIMDLVLSDARN